MPQTIGSEGGEPVTSGPLDPAALPPTLSVEEAAKLVGVGRNACYRAAHRGEIPAFRVGHKLRIPTAGLLRLLHIEDLEEAGP